MFERGNNGPNSLFDAPDPRRIASRPVASMALTMAEGAAVGILATKISVISPNNRFAGNVVFRERKRKRQKDKTKNVD